jgi:Stigma-specific protein, Stig1
MDAERFDNLTRRFAGSTSRRRLLKVVAGSCAGAAGGAFRGGTTALTAAFSGAPAAAYRKCRLEDGGRGRLCSGVCIDIKNDESNCGGCGRACAEGNICCNGWCTDTIHNAPGCCPPALFCDGVCVNPYEDEANCGACGNVCGENQDCCIDNSTGSGICRTRGTDLNCEQCFVCTNGFTCDPDANGPGLPGCVCLDESLCSFN